MRFPIRFVSALLSAGLCATAVQAAGDIGSWGDAPKNDDMAQGQQAVKEQNWGLAVARFKRAAALEPRNADAFNMLGYALRWQGKYEESFAAYGKALAINPEHRGALNYSGIAYIKTGQRARAEVNLARLQQLCAACEETTGLAKALAQTP